MTGYYPFRLGTQVDLRKEVNDKQHFQITKQNKKKHFLAWRLSQFRAGRRAARLSIFAAKPQKARLFKFSHRQMASRLLQTRFFADCARL